MRLDDDNVKVYIRCLPGDNTPIRKPKNCEFVCTCRFLQLRKCIEARACQEAVICRTARAALPLAAGVVNQTVRCLSEAGLVCFAEPMRCALRQGICQGRAPKRQNARRSSDRGNRFGGNIRKVSRLESKFFFIINVLLADSTTTGVANAVFGFVEAQRKRCV
jgi:hypothetical protein